MVFQRTAALLAPSERIPVHTHKAPAFSGVFLRKLDRLAAQVCRRLRRVGRQVHVLFYLRWMQGKCQRVGRLKTVFLKFSHLKPRWSPNIVIVLSAVHFFGSINISLQKSS